MAWIIIDTRKFDFNKSTGVYHTLECIYHGNETSYYTLKQIKRLNGVPCKVCNPDTE